MKNLFVSKTGTITSISQALSLINDSEPATILVDSGLYFEKISVRYDNITIKGICKENTIISFNDFAIKQHSDGYNFNTFRTFSLQILGNNVTLENLTIENTCNDSEKFKQAVALHIMGDKVKIKNCIIKSGQDTIFLGPLPNDLVKRYSSFLSSNELLTPFIARHYFENCQIFGDVDFIFGCGTAIFKDCDIICINNSGYIAAPSTDKNTPFGLTFINCKIKGKSPHAFYLARPWRDYGMSCFINCQMDDCITLEAFNKWNDTNRDKTCRFAIYQDNYDNFKIPLWVRKLSTEEALEYNIDNIFKDWNPNK